MKGKRRLSVSVRPAWIEAAQTAVAGGQAPSVSAWVDDALRLKVEHDRRLAALAAFLESYENTHGVITDEDPRRRSPGAEPCRDGPGPQDEAQEGGMTFVSTPEPCGRERGTVNVAI
jgi:hypothetical protein